MKIQPGKKVPEEVNVMIEIPKDTNIKYEYDKQAEAIFVDRFSKTTMNYPCNYGFIPGTLSGDGDPVDVLVLSEKSILPGAVLPARPIGMLEMEDESGIDAKVLAVPAVKGDLTYSDVKDISEISEMEKARIKHFFERYKDLDEGKWVKVKDWKGRQAAFEEITQGIAKVK